MKPLIKLTWPSSLMRLVHLPLYIVPLGSHSASKDVIHGISFSLHWYLQQFGALMLGSEVSLTATWKQCFQWESWAVCTLGEIVHGTMFTDTYPVFELTLWCWHTSFVWLPACHFTLSPPAISAAYMLAADPSMTATASYHFRLFQCSHVYILSILWIYCQYLFDCPPYRLYHLCGLLYLPLCLPSYPPVISGPFWNADLPYFIGYSCWSLGMTGRMPVSPDLFLLLILTTLSWMLFKYCG